MFQASVLKMEMNQKTEGASGITNWFLSSFHRRTKVGDLHLNHSDGNTMKDRAKVCEQSGEASKSSGSLSLSRKRCARGTRGLPK